MADIDYGACIKKRTSKARYILAGCSTRDTSKSRENWTAHATVTRDRRELAEGSTTRAIHGIANGVYVTRNLENERSTCFRTWDEYSRPSIRFCESIGGITPIDRICYGKQSRRARREDVFPKRSRIYCRTTIPVRAHSVVVLVRCIANGDRKNRRLLFNGPRVCLHRPLVRRAWNFETKKVRTAREITTIITPDGIALFVSSPPGLYANRQVFVLYAAPLHRPVSPASDYGPEPYTVY